MDFCQAEIVERFQCLPEPQDAYFAKSRIWRLVIYNNLGQAFNFHYKIKLNLIESLGAELLDPSWLTEISMTKLYGALENGETLSSIYIRINDILFDSQTEDELQDVDLIEDPLLRCLYQSSFGGYQKNQLRKLGLI